MHIFAHMNNISSHLQRFSNFGCGTLIGAGANYREALIKLFLFKWGRLLEDLPYIWHALLGNCLVWGRGVCGG